MRRRERKRREGGERVRSKQPTTRKMVVLESTHITLLHSIWTLTTILSRLGRKAEMGRRRETMELRCEKAKIGYPNFIYNDSNGQRL